jgi:N-acetyl-1-D-myo-inositol-2-amino-2-deoxy-alpha-D-glucopyranoside deacetylase
VGVEGHNFAGYDVRDQDLVTHRRRELADALGILGVHAHHWLGYRDSGMAGSSANDHPDAFHGAELAEAAARLAAVIRRERPQVVVSDDANGTYGHPDHIKAHHVTVRAVDLAADPSAPVDGAPWQVAKRYVHAIGREDVVAAHAALLDAGLASPFGEGELDPATLDFGVADDAITTEVDVSAWLHRKQAALAAHRSQIGEDSFFLNFPEDIATELFGFEQFILEAGVPIEVRPETDLFAGLRADRVKVGDS